MKPQDELHARQAFDSYCKKVLRNTARETYRKQIRNQRNEVTFSELSAREVSELYSVDVYGDTETVFDVLGKPVVVKGTDIAVALKELPKDRRDIVLLSYFIGMTDYEIARHTDILRRTVTNRRASTLRQLKKIMEEQGYERN